MRLLVPVVTLCLVAPLPLRAAPEEPKLLASADREARRMAASEEPKLLASADREARRMAASLSHQQSDTQRAETSSWVSRHPALVGTLVGAGAGTVMSLAMENELFCSGGDEDCLFHGGSRALIGAAMGAGVGALVGWIAGAARREHPVAKSPNHQTTRSPDRQIARSPGRPIAGSPAVP